MAEPNNNTSGKSRFVVHPVVFLASSVIILGFVILGVANTQGLADIVDGVQSFIVTYFGWFYILAVAGFLIFCVYLLFSHFGHIRLGRDDEAPEFSRFTWFSMLFSAGMGIGLLFFSVAEPLMHYSNPPEGEPESIFAAKRAMHITFFHWGLHPWGIYCLVGLALAYFSFRRGLPLTIRSAFHPLLGDRIHGPIGNVIDTTAVVSTLFGVATSLGLGVMQINAGFHYVFEGIPADSLPVRLILIAGITGIATISVVSGLNVGIRRLSELNMSLGAILCIFVLLTGPTIFILKLFVQSFGYYLQNLVETTFWTASFRDAEWQKNWTIFYWGWWIAWSPFVGMFIARISRGRTIREFILGTLLVPSIIGFLWLGIFGGAAIHQEMYQNAGLVEAVNESVPVALFQLLEKFPVFAITGFLATVVIISFFVTSSDSGSLVIDIITSGGHPDPPVIQRVFWALLEGAVAAVLLYTGYTMGVPEGGLAALQTASITTALPFSIVLIFMSVSLIKGFQQESADLPNAIFRAPEHGELAPEPEE